MYTEKNIRAACNRAISNILYDGITDVDLFNRPFELEFLKNQQTKKVIVDRISESISSNQFEKSRVKQYGKVLVPKKNLSDFRICALIDIYDEIYYLTLVILMATKIEKEKINIQKKKVYSYRFDSKGKSKLFKSEYNYSAFKAEVRKQENKDKNKVLIECDISNFYDRLNLHRLESTLLSIRDIDTDAVKLLNKLLLYWSNRDSYGIPVGSNASRILAEAVLTNVDKYLEEKGIEFYRFVDDYRILANNATEAHKYLTVLIERLQIEGLFINSNKTNIREVFKVDKKSNEENENEVKDEKLKEDTNTPTIIRGYSGLIPLKFREMTNHESEKLKKVNLEQLYTHLVNSILIQSQELKEFIKVSVAQEDWKTFTKGVEILSKFPQFIPYYIDIFIKKSQEFNEDLINELQNFFKGYLNHKDLPEYIQIYVLRFFSSEKTFSKDIILNYFYSLNRASGNYIGRATLEILENKLERRDLMVLRKYYERADIWEKRQILRLIDTGLPPDEKRAYFRNIEISNNDLFIEHMIKNQTK